MIPLLYPAELLRPRDPCPNGGLARRGAIGTGAQTVNWSAPPPFSRAGTPRAPCRFEHWHGVTPMELLTPLETICRLIIRARELDAQVPAQDPDEDPDDVA